MNARERILGRLHDAEPATAIEAPSVGEYYARVRHPATIERIEMLIEKLTAAHAEVHVCPRAQWAAKAADLLISRSVRRVLLPPGNADAATLHAALPASINAMEFARPIEAWKQELFNDIDAGFTPANCAIAATGTLVFRHDASLPRTLSLVPPIHLACVHAAAIYPDLYSVAHAQNWAGGMPTNVVLVSGPSKTADIQQTLAYGAHGPRELIVIVISDEGNQA